MIDHIRNSESPEIFYALDDIIRSESYVLDPSRAIVVDVLLDLGLPLTRRRLVDGHFDGLLVIGNHHRPQGRVFCKKK